MMRGVFMLATLAAAGVMKEAPGALWAQNPARYQSPEKYRELAKDILRELVEIKTTETAGTTAAAQAMARRLEAARFPAADVKLLGPVPHKANLVARLRGQNTGKKPILLLAHLDVVEADPADWSLHPFKFTEQNGWFYGRGTTDDKDEAAIWTANLTAGKKRATYRTGTSSSPSPPTRKAGRITGSSGCSRTTGI